MTSKQSFKSIYFPDYKVVNPNAQGLVLAFGINDTDLQKKIAPLSSQDIRELLQTNSYKDLEKNATKQGLTLNSYCLNLLKNSLDERSNTAKTVIDPIHTTFRGGRDNPLHTWYSYLEGYSPEFVEYILDNYAQNASVVYDPFAGTGVTALVAAQRGLSAFYSEVNPLLQSLVQTKIEVSLLPLKKKLVLQKNLESIREELESKILESDPDNELRTAYKETFVQSVFFDEDTFELVLKTRTLIDQISYSHQLTSRLLEVAVLNALIPSSLLQRAGDVRYKTKKELFKKTDFIDKTQENLDSILNDLENLEPLPSRPRLVTESAKNISLLPEGQIDTVITSPPYLNGTNYFRNTKVELWFLRSLKSKADLSQFRREAVTAGINDVSQKKMTVFTSEKVRRLVKKLEKEAYDQRIPKMVADYFQDIQGIFSGLLKHLSPKATVAIDIGDSVYAGVKVPTDDLIVETLEGLGYTLKESIVLRKRMSRSGEILQQVLLILDAPTKKPRKTINTSSLKVNDDWNTFKNDLPHTQQPYTKRNWGHPLHSLCSYQGKLKPSLSYFLVNTFAKPGQKILDPFAGVGTIPFEAALNGIESYGFDISPAAIHIARGKVESTNRDDVNRVLDALEKHIKTSNVSSREVKSAESFGFNKKLKDYYHPKTLDEILKSRQFFKHQKLDASGSLVLSSLLHILHGNRPYALSRRSHGITPFAPTGDYEYRALMPRLREKVDRGLAVEKPKNFVAGQILDQDATSWWPKYIRDLDAIITSPPFYDSTRFYLANWLRLWFSGWDTPDFSERPLGFVDEKQKMGFEVYEPILRQARERLKPNGVVVFHLGKSTKCDMTKKIAEVATPWFKVLDSFEESVEGAESFGVRDQGTVVKHQFLVLG